MPFISEILGKPVVDIDGKHIGKIDEILAIQKEKMTHPQVIAIQVKFQKRPVIISFSDIAVLTAKIIPLNKKWEAVKPYKVHKQDIFLVRDVLDKQIIDINGVRVVRVNDLELMRANSTIYVANVDISLAGMLRRMGIHHVPLAKTKKAGSISWDSVELLSQDEPMKLKVTHEKVSDLHPADLAEIISDLSKAEGGKFLQTLDDEVLADTLEELEPDFQASLLNELPDERAADILEEMSPDESADLLAQLPKNRSKAILKLMEKDEAADVQKLLSYPEESAGGIMSTDFVVVQQSYTASQAIEQVRRATKDMEAIYDISVIDREKRLKGSFTILDLLVANPSQKVTEFMDDRMICVNVKDSQDMVAKVIAKYNLLAVPVVDQENRLHGVVTADDALDKIIPTAWKKRLPRYYH